MSAWCLTFSLCFLTTQLSKSGSGEKGNKKPGTKYTGKVPKKAHTKKLCNLCKEHEGAHTMHNTKDCWRYKKDGTEKSNFRTTKKGKKNQSYKALFCAVKQEDGQAWDGDQETPNKRNIAIGTVIPTQIRELGWLE